MARTAVAGEPYELTGVHARRYLDAQRVADQCWSAVGIWLHGAELDFTLHTLERVFDGDVDRRVLVLAPGAVSLLLGAALRGFAKHRCEKFTELRFVAGSMARVARVLKALVPARRWTKVAVARRATLAATGDTVSQRVVGCTLVFVAQNVVGLVEVAHFDLGVGLFADVRVVFACQLAVGLADIVFGGGARNTERGVVVLEFHGSSMHPIPPKIQCKRHAGFKPATASPSNGTHRMP